MSVAFFPCITVPLVFVAMESTDWLVWCCRVSCCATS
jgi:hypothetical protein